MLICQVQNNARAFHMMSWSSARTGERAQSGAGFFSQAQRQCGGFARHMMSSAIGTDCRLVGAMPIVRSTGLEIRLARDPIQRFRQGQALAHAMPFAGVSVPHEIEAVPPGIVQAGEGGVELRLQRPRTI